MQGDVCTGKSQSASANSGLVGKVTAVGAGEAVVHLHGGPRICFRFVDVQEARWGGGKLCSVNVFCGFTACHVCICMLFLCIYLVAGSK